MRHCGALAGIEPRKHAFETTYFDTPDCELRRHELALRLRRAGNSWIQGLKARQRGAGAVHVREEWEYERPDPGIDLERFANTPLAALPHAAELHLRLRPVFRVVMDRTVWLVTPEAGSRLEVALDHGQVLCGARREEISEVEIECLEGGLEPALAFARSLRSEVKLVPSGVSKAERGFRLLSRMAAARR